MKKNNIFIILVLLIAFFTSCENVMDIHKDFIKDGETIYSKRLDSAYIVAGKGRLELNYSVSNAVNVKNIKVYWNDFQDSLVHPVSFGPDTIFDKIMITDLEEKSYTFTVQTEDKDGNKSLNITVFGTSYGDIYNSTLEDRRLKDLTMEPDGGYVTWYSASSNLIRNEIRYTDSNGDVQELILPSSEASIFCPNAQSKTPIEYRSVYIPEALSIDTFYTDWAQSDKKFPYISEAVDRSQWEILFYDNSDPNEGSPNNIIDNDKNSYWHSDYHNPTSYPYTFIIDMKEAVWIAEIGAQSRQNNHYSKGIEFYTIENYTNPTDGNWVKIGNFDLPQSNDFYWKFCSDEVLGKEIKTRYLKVVLTSGYNGEHLGAIAEIAVKRIAN